MPNGVICSCRPVSAIVNRFTRMSWLEQSIRRYEHRRWTTDDNRMVRPFEWGLEHIGGKLDEPDPRGFLQVWAGETVVNSARWFACPPANDYRLRDGVLTFTSFIPSPCNENNTVHAQFFQARKTGPAVVVLPNWNAKWEGQRTLCRWLEHLGITVLRLSLPYHDRRMPAGQERADQLVGPNIGLTLQANRQAVTDVRQCLRWLEQQGYSRFGILGTSIGSSIGYIAMVHDPAVRAGGFFHVSTYFADVVRRGMTTNHVWEGLRGSVGVDELRHYWATISPMPYVERGMGAGKRCFMVYGKHDPTFVVDLTREMLAAQREHAYETRSLGLPCGHYSLEIPPFSYIAGFRMGMFFLETLA